MKKRSVRLSPHIKPLRYRIMLKPDLEGFIFNGEETIYLEISKPTKEITLHSKEIEILNAELRMSNAELKIKSIKYNEKHETATFTTDRLIPKGKGELKIIFKGILNDKMRGFYRSSYTHQGKTKYLATTQFEATDARRAFPCFDEPAHKAVFDVTLMIPPGSTAISNTIETEVKEHESGYRAVKFAPSPKMSTYLLAFIVGDFEYIEGKTRDGVAVRVFVTPGKKHQANFALTCAIKTLEFYNKYFGIPYPLPVLDLIAIPDFTSGAMENWGAVTYRESALLVDPEHTSATNKQWVALVIAHELAHQWFGNLVTMEWWTDLWLNEGFASYIEYLAVDHLFPKWDIWTQFAYADLGVAMELDSLKNTHPIEIKVHHPDEIGEIFDAVSYSKGASIIRMLADYLGEKDFRGGLRYYLNKHKYANASTVDLWKAFEKASGKPVTKIMQNWTKKPGYPLVKIIQGKKHIQLKQSRFYSSRISKKQSSDKTIWDIPVKVTSDKLQVTSHLFSKKKDLLRKSLGSWLKINAGETGFFRTDYPAQMLSALWAPIKNKELPPIDRLGIIRDAFALSEAGQLPTTQSLELAINYSRETDYTVWTEIVSGLESLSQLLAKEKFYLDFSIFAQGIFKKIVKHVGFSKRSKEHHTVGLLRSVVLYQAGKFGHKKIIAWALKQFKNFRNKNKKIPPDLRGVVYNLAAQNGDAKGHKFLIKLYQTESLHEERNRIGRALGQFKSKKLLKKTLNFSLSKAVRFQDMPGILVSVWNNPQGRELAWAFVKKHIKTIMDRYALGGHMLSRILAPAGNFVSETDAKEIQNFFKIHPAPGAARTIAQVLEKIRSNSAWLSEEKDNIERWLEKNV